MKYLCWVCCFCAVLSARGQSFTIQGFASDTIPVTVRKMTSLIFPAEIGAGIWVTKDVLVQRVKGVRNAIELKAERRDFTPTNLSVYGRDGRLYSFELRFVEDTSVLNFMVGATGASRPLLLSDLPASLPVLDSSAAALAARRGFVRVSASTDGLRLKLAGVWSRDSLMWLVIRVNNRVPVALAGGSLRLFVQDAKRVRRMATQEIDVPLLYGSSLSELAGDSSVVMALAIRPVFVPTHKRLVISLVSRDRMVMVRVKGKVLRRMRRG